MLDLTLEAPQAFLLMVIFVTMVAIAYFTYAWTIDHHDPYTNILAVDRMTGGNSFGRVVHNLRALDQYYQGPDETASFPETEIHRVIFQQVETDAKFVVGSSKAARDLFMKTLRSLGYRIITYREDNEEPVSFEIHSDGYSVQCSYG